MRTADELLASGLAVLERAYCMGAYHMAPLFSGGHDSLCACHIASQHRSFLGIVHQIDTGIGSKYTREFSQRVCDKFGWQLKVWKSVATYEEQVRLHGFPGPGQHGTTYNRLKDRCIYKITKGKNWTMLVNGARAQESVRRMGRVQSVTIGDANRRNLKRVWTAPCHDWSKAEQQHYMDEFGLPINRIKVLVGLSGECFCGAFAQPGELDLIRQHAPDVAEQIDRLASIAKSCGKPCVWGQRPAGTIDVAETGPLCSSCDQRMAGILLTGDVQ